ncbi:MAG: hypothetical protein LBM04_08720 [Opitutaceae bacterium]|jgi:hypothetical protein|nr:hypothetical protein [Opitutaceae bacterium]
MKHRAPPIATAISIAISSAISTATAIAAAFGILVLCVTARGKDTPLWSAPDISKAPAELEAQWQQITGGKPVGVRGVFRFALEAAGVDWRPDRVEKALAFARTLQDTTDPTGGTFGNFRWRSDHDRVLDRNGVEFAAQLMILIHKTQHDRLTPAARDLLRQMMTDAITGLQKHKVQVSYTNIWLKNACAQIILGEILDRPEVARAGRERLDEWLRFTAQNGITEYGAVTYYGTDLDALALIAKFAAQPETRAKAMQAIRYLWTDSAANWWTAGDRLACANARSYDYLYGRGYFEAHTWTAGWLRELPGIENAGWIGADHANLVTFRQAVTIPPRREWTDAITAQLPRTVVQRWGEKPENTATAWIGRHASLASSGAGRGSDERTLVANLGNSPAIPQLTLFMDGRGDPFGTKKIANAANQAKSLHIVPFIATVQRGAEVLQLLSSEPLGQKTRHKPGELSCFLTQLTVPASAEIRINGKIARAGTPGKPLAVPAGATVAFRIGDAAIALRILYSDTTQGAPANVQLVADSEKIPARRLTIIHDEKEPRGRASTIVWMRAAENLNDSAFAKFIADFAAAKATARVENNIARVEAAGLRSPMRIETDIVKQQRIAIEGGEPRPALLSVNGRETGLPVFNHHNQ